METLLSIIDILRLDETFFLYFAAFLFLLFIVSRYLMAPYYQAFLARFEQTEGQIQNAGKIQEENQKLKKEYETRFALINSRFQKAFKEKLSAIVCHQQTLADEARSQAQVLVGQAEKSLTADFNEAKKQLKELAPGLALELSQKLLHFPGGGSSDKKALKREQ